MSSPIYNSVKARLISRMRQDDLIDEVMDKAFMGAEVISSTNVTQYYFAGTDQEFWHLDKHFPNLAPLFDSFWIETKAPTHITSKVYGQKPWTFLNSHHYSRPERWGAWFLNSKLPDTPEFQRESAEIFARAQLSNPLCSPKDYWLYCIMLFTQTGDDIESCFPVWSFVFLIDKATGELMRNPVSHMPDPFPWISDPMGAFRREIIRLEEEQVPNIELKLESGKMVSLSPREVFEMEAISLLKPLMLAISFMHCKNVERVPNYPSVKVNKRRVARNLPPFNKFYTLEIEPMKKIIQQAVASYRGLKGASGIEMALHSVKGHFKTYTPAKPLLGHAVGTWFWAGITRGSKKRGAVKKEYEVKI